jgi:hypothetical protein
MRKNSVFGLGKDKKANHKEEKKMKYDQKIILKNGKEAWLRNGDASDIIVIGSVFRVSSSFSN